MNAAKQFEAENPAHEIQEWLYRWPHSSLLRSALSPWGTAIVQNLVAGFVVVAFIFMGVLAYAQKHEGCLHGRSLQTLKPCGSVSATM
jgi:membrane protein YqaA with SNARE-associated domain